MDGVDPKKLLAFLALCNFDYCLFELFVEWFCCSPDPILLVFYLMLQFHVCSEPTVARW